MAKKACPAHGQSAAVTREVGGWRVHDADLVRQVLGTESLVFDLSLADYLRELGARSGRNLQPIIEVLTHLTLVQEGEQLAERRRDISQNFSRIAVPQTEDIAEICASVLAELPESGEVDGRALIAHPLVMRMFRLFDGIPEAELLGFFDAVGKISEFATGLAPLPAIDTAAREVEVLLEASIGRMQAEGFDRDGALQRAGTVANMLVGLHVLEGTVTLALQELASDAALQNGLRRDRKQIATYAHEAFLRLSGSPIIQRRSTSGTELLNGEPIPAGTLLTIDLPSLALAHDSGGRSPNLAFGHGRHKCVGMPLAYVVLPMLLSALLDRWTIDALEENPPRERSRVNRLAHVPLRLSPAPQAGGQK